MNDMKQQNLLNDYINSNSAYLMSIFVFIYALYIQIYGEEGPGGGFQGGILVACGFILHSFVFGVIETLKIIPFRLMRVLCATGVSIYFLTGFYSLFFKKNFLNYNVIISNNIHLAQKIGVFLVEIGVGMTVFSAMLLIFFALSIFTNNIKQLC